MQSGRDRLCGWIGRSKMKQNEAAELLGVPPPMLSQWLNGVRTPGLDNAIKIEQITGISVESWVLAGVSKTDPADLVGAGKRKIAKR